MFDSTCVPDAKMHRWPATPVGAFKAALDRGTLRVAYNGGITNDRSPSGLVVVDSTTNPPTGLMVQFVNAVVARIGTAYNRRHLTLEWSFCASTTACFDMLQSGIVDALLGKYRLSSDYANTTVRFYNAQSSPCKTWTEDALPTWVKSTSPLVSIADLQAAIARGDVVTVR
jgi:hypothetical protein